MIMGWMVSDEFKYMLRRRRDMEQDTEDKKEALYLAFGVDHHRVVADT